MTLRVGTFRVYTDFVGAAAYSQGVAAGTVRSSSQAPPGSLTDTELLSAVHGPALAVMLYGSQARGTATTDSDIDVLQLVDSHARPYISDGCNVTQYTDRHLLRMAESGSLFILHLRTDGRILCDPRKRLEHILDRYNRPRSYMRLRRDLALAASALDLSVLDARDHIQSLARLGVYLLRTLIYIECDEVGEPNFDMGRILTKLSDPTLCSALSLRKKKSTEYCLSDIALLTSALERRLGTRIKNSTGSIAALAIDSGNNPYVESLLASVLSDDAEIDYAQIDFPPL